MRVDVPECNILIVYDSYRIESIILVFSFYTGTPTRTTSTHLHGLVGPLRALNKQMQRRRLMPARPLAQHPHTTVLIPGNSVTVSYFSIALNNKVLLSIPPLKLTTQCAIFIYLIFARYFAYRLTLD